MGGVGSGRRADLRFFKCGYCGIQVSMMPGEYRKRRKASAGGETYCSLQCANLAAGRARSGRREGGRKCGKCGIVQPLDSFRRDHRSADGRDSICKECRWAMYRVTGVNGGGVCPPGMIHPGFHVKDVRADPVRGEWRGAEAWLCPVCGMASEDWSEAKHCCQGGVGCD